MKSILIHIGAALLLCVSVSANGQTQKVVESSFWVGGVCSMCKNRIESALDVKGIKYADYELASHTLTVVYKTKKINEDQIHVLLNEIGHDTAKSKASDEVYEKIHGCCRYREHKHGDPSCDDK